MNKVVPIVVTTIVVLIIATMMWLIDHPIDYNHTGQVACDNKNLLYRNRKGCSLTDQSDVANLSDSVP